MLRAEQEGTTPDAPRRARHGRAQARLCDLPHQRRQLSDDALAGERGAHDGALSAARGGGFITRKTIKQAYDEKRQMFLPDRYVRARARTAARRINTATRARSAALPTRLSTEGRRLDRVGTKPSVREFEHLFLKLSAFEDELKRWVPQHVDEALARKLDEWFKAGLKDWDISRDAPYFGFRIPGERDKFFYVWFDAPIGYMASSNLCRRENIDFDEFWGARQHELYHFIGKDIPYFHALFWPAMLGRGYRKPSGLFVHGHVTVDGQKSRSAAVTRSRRRLREEDRSRLPALLLRVEARADDRRPRSEPRRLRRQGQLGSRRQAREHREPLRGLRPQARRRPARRPAAGARALRRVRGRRRRSRRRFRAARVLACRAQDHGARRPGESYIDDKKPWIMAKNPSAAARSSPCARSGSTCSAR